MFAKLTGRVWILVLAWGAVAPAGMVGECAGAEGAAPPARIDVGFAETDITPELKPGHPVWLAGYGMGRRAMGVHDPLMARCVVLRSGEDRLAWVSVDLIGLQLPEVRKIRERLPGFRNVMVSSTHNHEGPDVIGIWGRSPLSRGVDPNYVELVIERVAAVVREAEKNLAPADAAYGVATDEVLLGDSRQPFVKDGVLRTLRFTSPEGKLLGLVVQWNCHPEALGSRNTQITADFPAYTVAKLKQKYGCPIAYFSGAVGGLMAPPDGVVHDEAGKELKEGDFEYARRYGESVADLAGKALDAVKPIRLAPFVVSTKTIAVPIENKLYRVARLVGVLQRAGREWTGDPENLGPVMGVQEGDAKVDGKFKPLAIETEVGYLRLGELHVACIPGELYPELVYGQIPDPAEPNVDFPDAPREPSVTQTLGSDKWLLFGLANDEIGYIIPRRQWDAAAPYAYGKPMGQYGEINSCSAEVAPIVMNALVRRVREANEAKRP